MRSTDHTHLAHYLPYAFSLLFVFFFLGRICWLERHSIFHIGMFEMSKKKRTQKATKKKIPYSH